MLTREELIASLRLTTTIREIDALYRNDSYSFREQQERMASQLPPIRRLYPRTGSIRYERAS